MNIGNFWEANQLAEIVALRPSKTRTWGTEESEFSGLVDLVLPEASDTSPDVVAGNGSTETIQALAQELRDLRSWIIAPTRTRTVVLPRIPAQYREVHTALAEAIESGSPISLRRPNDIPLHSLLRFAAVLTFTVCGGSLAMWLGDFPSLVNPFASMLGIVASPFLFAMGEAARIPQ